MLCAGIEGPCHIVVSVLTVFLYCLVPSGGEDSPEAVAGVCGVHRV